MSDTVWAPKKFPARSGVRALPGRYSFEVGPLSALQPLLYAGAEIRTLAPAMADDPDPPRKFYEFKPREFEVVNPRANEAQPTAPINVKDLLRQAGSSKPGGVAPADLTPKNEVHTILQENVANNQAKGLEELTPLPPRKSRRKREFFTLLIIGNAVCGGLAYAAGPNSAIAFASAVGAMGLITAGLTWVMWFVMDDY